MANRWLALALTVLALAAPVRAEPPQVVADIPAVHSLTSQVMGDLGPPKLLMRQGASPHGYAMRPSEAAALQAAHLVVWIGPALTPWLDRAMAPLAPEARSLVLLDAPGTIRRAIRETPTFGGHDHREEQPAGAQPDRAGATENPSRAVPDHTEGRARHRHGPVDPHAWLDPVNTKTWLDAIADALARADPQNANIYAANAAAGKAALDALRAEIATTLAPVADGSFIVFHDSFQYFEARFGVTAAGAISAGDAAAPGPARLAALRDRIAGAGPRCVLAEPQFDPALVRMLTEGGKVETAVVDPLGTDHAPGPGLYAALLRQIAQTLAACASP